MVVKMKLDDKLQLFLTRRSIRSFDNKPIDKGILDQILEAGRWTYSAVNKQPWSLYVIQNEELKKKIVKECTSGPWASQAPILIVLVAHTDIQPDWYMVDLSFMALQLTLAAWNFGVGTCFIGIINRDNVKKLLKLKEKDYVFTVLPVGYPKSIPKSTPRKSFEDFVKFIN